MQRVAAGRFGRAQWAVALQHHGYTEGHAHIMPGGPAASSRMASCETAVFVWATDAAAARWPASAEAEAALRAAMRVTVPRRIKQRATKEAKRAKKAKKAAR